VNIIQYKSSPVVGRSAKREDTFKVVSQFDSSKFPVASPFF